MRKRSKTGGREAGTPNKATAEIREQIRAADPISFLVEVVNHGRVPILDDNGAVTGSYEAIPSLPRINAAIKLANKLTPDAKERAVVFEVGKIKGVKDAHRAMGKAIEALGGGTLTTREVSAVCAVIGQYIRSYEANEISSRLDDLEERLSK